MKEKKLADVVMAKFVIGGPDIHVEKGSMINLTCTVKYSPEVS